MNKVIILALLVVLTVTSGLLVKGYVKPLPPVANPGVTTESQPTQQPAVQDNKIPTLEQLEAQLKKYEEEYPKMAKQAQQMQIDIIVLQGAIFREKQLTGIPNTPVEEPKEEVKP